MAEGCLIVFEGIDGAGTTTHTERYAAHLRAARRPVHVTREPSGGPIGSLLRLALTGRLPLASAHQAEVMTLLFAADRLDHIDHEIAPHLREGCTVLCDRYVLSSIAYQTATARADVTSFESWVRSCNRDAIRPTATVVLDVPPAVAEQRRALRRGAPELYEESALQARLAAIYARAPELLPDERVIVIDASGEIDEVAARIREALAPVVR
jgi:dTMP kinase